MGMRQRLSWIFAFAAIAIAAYEPVASAESNPDFQPWAIELDTIISQGEALFTDPFYSENGKSCSECHAAASATHAETFPKYRPKQGRVIQLWEMVNWCLEKALGKEPIAANDPEMTALVSYLRHASTKAFQSDK